METVDYVQSYRAILPSLIAAHSRRTVAERLVASLETPGYVQTYKATLAALTAAHGREMAMELIVGGQYREIGILEKSVLLTLGLQPAHTLVDIGCGSGRLAVALKDYLTGRYIGTDILGEALDYAREKAGRPDWEFHETFSPHIPLADEQADLICFFSVFTHLLDEDIYHFLREAKRVCLPGGKIIFSYLDFDVGSHWPVFEHALGNSSPHPILNRFLSKTAIRRWCQHLDLEIQALHDGCDPWIRLTDDFLYSDGRLASGTVEFGQSVGVLRAK